MKQKTRIEMTWELVIGLALTLMALMTPERAFALKKPEGNAMKNKSRMHFGRKVLNLISIFLIGISIPIGASALEFIGDKCEFTSAELSNPDAVIELALSRQKKCTTVFNAKRIPPKINLPHFGEWSMVYPENSIRQLLEKYGVPKDEPFEPASGEFREWKVKNKQQTEKIDEHEVIEYTVELLYVSLTGWTHIPGSGHYGVIPVCERSTVKFYAIKTERGWLVERPMGIGFSTRLSEKNFLENHYKKNPEEGRRHIERTYRTVQDQCKDHLN